MRILQHTKFPNFPAKKNYILQIYTSSSCLVPWATVPNPFWSRSRRRRHHALSKGENRQCNTLRPILRAAAVWGKRRVFRIQNGRMTMNGRERGEKELLSSFLWFDERRSITCRLVTAEVFLAQFFLLFMVLLFAGKGFVVLASYFGKIGARVFGRRSIFVSCQPNRGICVCSYVNLEIGVASRTAISQKIWTEIELKALLTAQKKKTRNLHTKQVLTRSTESIKRNLPRNSQIPKLSPFLQKS